MYIKCIWADTSYPAGTATFYKYDKPQYIPLNIIAQQIIQNAQNGHQPSIDFLKDVADDVAKQSVSNGDDAKSDVKPINPPKDESNEPKQCKPCQPYPIGTVGYIGPKKSLRGIHGTRTGTDEEHYILYRVGQKSSQRGCECYWQEDKSIAGHHYMTQPNIFLTVNLNHKIIGNKRTKFLPYP